MPHRWGRVAVGRSPRWPPPGERTQTGGVDRRSESSVSTFGLLDERGDLLMAVEYLLDSSAIISHPEILNFKSSDLKLTVIWQTLDELGFYRYNKNNSELRKLVNRAISVGNLKQVGAYGIYPPPSFGRSKAVDTSIVSYVIDQKAKGAEIFCVSSDLDILIPLRERNAALTPEEFVSRYEASSRDAATDAVGLALFRRRSKFDLASNVVTSIVSVLVTAAIFHFLDQIITHLYVLGWAGAVVITMFLGLGIFWVRQNFRLPYALAEITVGILSVLTSVSVAENGFPVALEANLNATIKLAGGLYVIVRGLDNFGKWIENRNGHQLWKRLFP